MENRSRNMEKSVSFREKQRQLKKQTQWSLVYISDLGQIKSARWIKVLCIFFAVCFFISGATTLVGYYLYQQVQESNRQLKNKVSSLRQYLKSENLDRKQLMEKISQLEAQLSTMPLNRPTETPADGKDQQKADNSNPDVGQKPASSPPTPPTTEVAQPEMVPESQPDASETNLPQTSESDDTLKSEDIPDAIEPPQTDTSAPVASMPPDQIDEQADTVETTEIPASTPSETVSEPEPEPPIIQAENFQISRKGRRVEVAFDIRKTSSDETPVSGHAVVVLKAKDTQPDNWVALPSNVKLVSGRPTGKQKGKTFRIARFRPLSFRTSVNRKAQFDTASVYIFDSEGNLLFERNFSVLSN